MKTLIICLLAICSAFSQPRKEMAIKRKELKTITTLEMTAIQVSSECCFSVKYVVMPGNPNTEVKTFVGHVTLLK